MKIVSSIALAGVLTLGIATVAQAQSTSLAPSVPNPANPYPLNPVASDGTPLPRYNGVDVYSGRSAYVAPGYGYGPGVVGGAVDDGLGVAGAGVDTGLGVVDDVLR